MSRIILSDLMSATVVATQRMMSKTMALYSEAVLAALGVYGDSLALDLAAEPTILFGQASVSRRNSIESTGSMAWAEMSGMERQVCAFPVLTKYDSLLVVFSTHVVRRHSHVARVSS